MKRHDMFSAILCASHLLIAIPVAAQNRSKPEDVTSEQIQQPLRPVETGRSADSAIGRPGERQTRDQVITNVEPMGRIDSRISTRIPLRIRNRIDRNYDPQFDATSSIESAEDQVRGAGRRR